MAASRDQNVTRPQSQRRISVTSSSTLGVPARQSTGRHHSHSISLGSINPNHRVSRRRSVNTASVHSLGTVRACINELQEVEGKGVHTEEQTLAMPFGNSNGQGRLEDGFQLEDPFHVEHYGQGSAIAEEFGPVENTMSAAKPRGRRASEGSHLTKSEGKRSSAELRCEKCGKGYKHSSCLTKHLWEHDPAWAYTSKLLISKHQQVQLLEAASVLVNMNQDATETEALKTTESGNSSASPAASGSSDIRYDIDDDDEYSSAETTPPPMSEQYAMAEGISTGRAKRYSGFGSSYSRSYQSAPTGSFSYNNGLSPYTPNSRPSTSGYAEGMSNGEESELAAAVATLCNFGTPKSCPVLLPSDVPPVPPLPARYIEQYQLTKSGEMLAQSDFELPSPSYQPLSYERDVRTGGQRSSSHHDHDIDYRPLSNRKNDEDEGVFGGMEGIAHVNHQELRNL